MNALTEDFIEFGHHPQRIFQAFGHAGSRVFAGRLGQIGLQHTGLSFSPPTMLLSLRLVVAPAVVSHLNPTTIALNHCNAAFATIGWCVIALPVLLIGDTRPDVGVDAFLLFDESFVADPNRDALPLAAA